MKGQKLLKVTSILMIIGGVIAVIAGILAILGISALVALSESAEGAGLLYASSTPAPSLWLWHLSFSSLLALRALARAARLRRRLPASSGALSSRF